MLAIRINVLLDSGLRRNDEVIGKTPKFNILSVRDLAAVDDVGLPGHEGCFI